MSKNVSSRRKRQHQRILEHGVLGPYVRSYSAYLSEHGYARNTACFYLSSVLHFSHWLARKKISLKDINEHLVYQFVARHLPNCDCVGRYQRGVESVRAALTHLLRTLRAEKRIPARVEPFSRAIQEELSRFDTYLDRTCGLAATTRVVRVHYAKRFLQGVFKDNRINMTRLKVSDIQQFVAQHGEGYTKGSIQVVCSCLRTYLRFRAFEGDLTQGLIAAVPRVPHWRLASLPKALTDRELKRFLVAFDRRTPVGRRDYAIARCLVDLGLRSAEVANLKLEHFDWREGTLKIVGAKGRRMSVLPLPVPTGHALVEYLRRARPRCTSRWLFLRHLAPRDCPLTPTIVRWAMRCAYVRSGISKPWSGVHVMRHSVASRLVNAGASLKEIADVLRHKSLDTTMIYTKVDLRSLSTVALPWPARLS